MSEPKIRTFNTGATRDTDAGKHDFIGYLSPLVLEAFARYMTKHRLQPDGSMRGSDNWKRGIPRDAYVRSAMRHFMDVWQHHEGHAELAREPLEDALMALLFNIQGFAHEFLKEQRAQNSGACFRDLPA